jgi:hypothetical protein
LNPARCQRTTVSGWTRINACFHPGQNHRKITQWDAATTLQDGEARSMKRLARIREEKDFIARIVSK